MASMDVVPDFQWAQMSVQLTMTTEKTLTSPNNPVIPSSIMLFDDSILDSKHSNGSTWNWYIFLSREDLTRSSWLKTILLLVYQRNNSRSDLRAILFPVSSVFLMAGVIISPLAMHCIEGILELSSSVQDTSPQPHLKAALRNFISDRTGGAASIPAMPYHIRFPRSNSKTNPDRWLQGIPKSMPKYMT